MDECMFACLLQKECVLWYLFLVWRERPLFTTHVFFFGLWIHQKQNDTGD